MPVYYISKALITPKICYPQHGEVGLGLDHSFQKLRPYFQVHITQVLTKFSLRYVLQKLDALERLSKWVIELSEFDIHFKLRATIKG